MYPGPSGDDNRSTVSLTCYPITFGQKGIRKLCFPYNPFAEAGGEDPKVRLAFEEQGAVMFDCLKHSPLSIFYRRSLRGSCHEGGSWDPERFGGKFWKDGDLHSCLFWWTVLKTFTLETAIPNFFCLWWRVHVLQSDPTPHSAAKMPGEWAWVPPVGLSFLPLGRLGPGVPAV